MDYFQLGKNMALAYAESLERKDQCKNAQNAAESSMTTARKNAAASTKAICVNPVEKKMQNPNE